MKDEGQVLLSKINGFSCYLILKNNKKYVHCNGKDELYSEIMDGILALFSMENHFEIDTSSLNFKKDFFSMVCKVDDVYEVAMEVFGRTWKQS